MFDQKRFGKALGELVEKELLRYLKDEDTDVWEQIHTAVWDLVTEETKAVMKGREFRSVVKRMVSRVATNHKLIDSVVASVTLELIKKS